MKNVALGAVLFLAGCASVTPSTFNHSEGKQAVIRNSIDTSASFDTVWDSVVSKLSQSFFVINNIDKQSRIINISFNVDSPEKYIDCGTSQRSFDFQNEHMVYDYPVAASNSYRMMTTWNSGALPAVVTMNRKAKMDGRANIYIAPNQAGGSTVSVNSIYVWSVDVTGRVVGYNAFGAPGLLNEALPPIPSTTVNFTTKSPGSSKDGKDSITCASTGLFEESVIELVPKS